MGCESSKLPDSNAHDPPQINLSNKEESDHGLIPHNKVHPEHANGGVPAENENNSDFLRRSMKGDLTMYSEAKIHREKTMKERLRKRELQAGEISERAMEEKEWLSLTSTRSRATSRVGSPKHGRGAGSAVTASELPIQLPSEPQSPTDATPKKDHKHKVKSSNKVIDGIPNGTTQQTLIETDSERNNNTNISITT